MNNQGLRPIESTLEKPAVSGKQNHTSITMCIPLKLSTQLLEAWASHSVEVMKGYMNLESICPIPRDVSQANKIRPSMALFK